MFSGDGFPMILLLSATKSMSTFRKSHHLFVKRDIIAVLDKDKNACD